MLRVDLKDNAVAEAYNALVEAVDAKRQRAQEEAAVNAAKFHISQAMKYIELAGNELNINDLINNEGDK
mgnify:FL=1